MGGRQLLHIPLEAAPHMAKRKELIVIIELFFNKSSHMFKASVYCHGQHCIQGTEDRKNFCPWKLDIIVANGASTFNRANFIDALYNIGAGVISKIINPYLKVPTSAAKDLAVRWPSPTLVPFTPRLCPLPSLEWFDSRQVWLDMVHKDLSFKCDANMLINHPQLNPSHRFIMLKWITEICEYFEFQRETFYLALDYTDRYLSFSRDLSGKKLRLSVLTALFIAMKVEEEPEQVAIEDLIETCSGIVSREEIFDQEKILLKSLQWKLHPLTANSWLKMYHQLSHILTMDAVQEETLLVPRYSSFEFIQSAILLDHAVLRLESAKFSYSKLAASAFFYYNLDEEQTVKVSGYHWDELADCVAWMEPTASYVYKSGPISFKKFEEIYSDDKYNIQTAVGY